MTDAVGLPLLPTRVKKLAKNSLQTVVDQQIRILKKLPEKDVEPLFKQLKQYVEKYEEVLKETYVEI